MPKDGNGKTEVRVKIDNEDWEKVKKIAKYEDRTATAQLRIIIKDSLKLHWLRFG
mgnify:CR=1 FL=1